MNSSILKNETPPDKRTKAELMQLLDVTLEKTQQLNKKMSTCQKELENTRNKSEEFKKENAKIKQQVRDYERIQLKLQKLETEHTSLNDERNRLTKENQNLEAQNKSLQQDLEKQISEIGSQRIRYQQAEQTIKLLKEEVARLKNTLLTHSNARAQTTFTEEERPKAPKTNIRLEITPVDDNYRVRFIDVLTREQLNFEEVDADLKGIELNRISDFLKKHLPQSEDQSKEKMQPEEQYSGICQDVIIKEEKPALPEEEPSIFKTKSGTSTFSIEQNGQIMAKGQRLNARMPFHIISELHLPYPPTEKNVDIDRPHYGIRVRVNNKKTQALAFDQNFTDELKLGKQDYQISLPMPILENGEYEIRLLSVVPFAHIGEEENLPVQIGYANF